MYRDLPKDVFNKIIEEQENAAKIVGVSTTEAKEKRLQFIESTENGVKIGTSLNKFYLFFNIKGSRITWSSSVKEYTGYPDRQDSHPLTFYDTLNWVHPAYFEYYMAHAMAAYKLMSEVDIRKGQYYYIIKFKLVKSDRKTIIDVMQTSLPLTFDKKGVMIAHFNEYQIIGNGETRISLSTPILKNKEGEVIELKGKLAGHFKNITSIDPNKYEKGHLYVLKRYADAPNITAQQIADSGPLVKNTINTYNAQIIKKTKEFLDTETHGLHQARDIAIVYRDLGLI